MRYEIGHYIQYDDEIVNNHYAPLRSRFLACKMG